MIGEEVSIDETGLFKYRVGYLADHRLDYIDLWARRMLQHPKIGDLGLTARQRRHIASIMWHREVARANDHLPSTRQQPPPLLGMDARNRPVVQQYDGNHLRQYALTKEGDGTDITEPVFSLNTGERVRITDRANVKEQY